MNAWADVTLRTDLPPDECVARLTTALARAATSGTDEVKGRVDGRSVRLRRRIDHMNSYQIVLVGTFTSHGSGTVFTGVADYPLLSCFAAGVTYLLAAVGCLGVAVSVIGGRVPPSQLGIILAVVAGVALGTWFVRRQARADTAVIAAFLSRVVGANREGGTGP